MRFRCRGRSWGSGGLLIALSFVFGIHAFEEKGTLAAALLALLVGAGLGLLAGFSRGPLDGLIRWSADLSLAFPELILVLLGVSLLGREPWLIVLTVAFAFLPGMIRQTRDSTSCPR